MINITPLWLVALTLFTLSLCTTTYLYIVTLGRRVRSQTGDIPFPSSMYTAWIVMVVTAVSIDAIWWSVIMFIIGLLVWNIDYDNRLAQYERDASNDGH